MAVIKQMRILFWSRGRQIFNRFKDFHIKDSSKYFFFFVLTIAFLLGTYWTFWRLLNVLIDVPIFGIALINKIISMIFLIFTAMLIFSSIITSFGSLYFAPELPLLFSVPIQTKSLLWYKFTEPPL